MGNTGPSMSAGARRYTLKHAGEEISRTPVPGQPGMFDVKYKVCSSTTMLDTHRYGADDDVIELECRTCGARVTVDR